MNYLFVTKLYAHYRYWQVPYFWAGLKAYDMVAGNRKLEWSYLISKKRALELFPMLKHDSLVGALVYYDGIIYNIPVCSTRDVLLV